MEKVDIKPIHHTRQEHQEEKEGAQIKESSSEKENKNVALVLIVILAAFALLFAGFKYYNAANPEPITIEEYHQANLNGELPEDKGYVYNGLSFVKVDNLWWTDIQREGHVYRLPLHFGPRDVENISISGVLNKSFNQGQRVYITIDPEVQDKFYTLAVSELSTNVAQGINRIPVGACTKDDPACENRTIINCETANGTPVIEIALESPARIELQNSCVKVYGQKYDLIRSVDRLLLSWYNIILKE